MAEQVNAWDKAVIESAFLATEQDFQQAKALESQASQLRTEATKRADTAINDATGELIVDYERGLIPPREALAAAIDIRLFRPSRLIGNHAIADKEVLLDRFDRLGEEGTILFNETTLFGTYDKHLGTEITAGRTPEVKLFFARGLGGLPEAEVRYMCRDIRRKFDGEVRVDKGEALSEPTTIEALGRFAVGTEEIQEFLNSLTLRERAMACGHGKITNEATLRAAHDGAQRLIAATGVELDISHLESLIPQGANR